MKFIILWATNRTSTFKATCKEWIDKCTDKDNLIIKVAVNDEEAKKDLEGYDVTVVKTDRVGVTYSMYALSSSLNYLDYDNKDIVILASDDFFPPDKWNEILKKEFENYNGCIIFNDLNPNFFCNVVQIPIMTFGVLKDLNMIIYNPAYFHFSSDRELYDVLEQSKRIKDVSKTKPEIIFEHRHHTVGKRTMDISDLKVRERNDLDASVYQGRKSKTFFEKTSVADLTYIRKKIISYSLYGTNEVYLNGAVENAKIQRMFYPGWTSRFYVSDDVPEATKIKLRKYGAQVIHKGVSDGHLGLYWRMEAFFDDPMIDCVIIRDCDSRLNWREVYAVDEWLKSDKVFHIMRDHPSGHNSQMMVGMMGMKMGTYNLKDEYNLWMQTYDPMSHPFSRTRGKHFFGDQMFANTIIWPKLLNNHIAHDEYFKFSGNELPFRFRYDQGLFVGQRFTKDNQPVWE
jgi:hypothetical protein